MNALNLNLPGAFPVSSPAPAPSTPPGSTGEPPSAHQTTTTTTTPRTCVIFQDACTDHRYIRNSDIGSIVERPERIRAVKIGTAAAWARLEEKAALVEAAASGQATKRWKPPSQKESASEHSAPKVEDAADDLEKLMQGLGLVEKHKADGGGKGKEKEVVGGPFDILFSSAMMPINDPALQYVHPLRYLSPEEEDEADNLSSKPSPASPSTPHTSPSRPFSSAKALSPPPLLPPTWPAQLQTLCRDSSTAILTSPFSEIPASLPQGDLYLCPGSEGAIFGALGAVCEGVDRVVEGSKKRKKGEAGEPGHDRTFVAIRPPGHHCCEANPMGFCFVNNVAVAAAHAYQQHNIDRVIIVDIDLHHGNGTQEIAWRINAAANAVSLQQHKPASPRKNSPSKLVGGGAKQPAPPPPLKIMYASLHDVFSYPCEDGDAAMVQAASLNLSGGHSQYISNVHLDTFDSETDFHSRLYPRYREGLLGAAADFCRKTSSSTGPDHDAERTLLIISAGFDASEHESGGMSRHARNVPTSFYSRFTADAVEFAERWCGGKLVSVLEGGYSDRALASASLAMLSALVESPRGGEEVPREDKGNPTSSWEVGEGEMWWEEKALVKLEKACKPIAASGRRAAVPVEVEPWLSRTVEIFQRVEGVDLTTLLPAKEKEKSRQVEREQDKRTMQLRERRPRGGISGESTPNPSPSKPRAVSQPNTFRSTTKGATAQAPPLPPLPTLTLPSLSTLPPLPPLPPFADAPSAPVPPAVSALLTPLASTPQPIPAQVLNSIFALPPSSQAAAFVNNTDVAAPATFATTKTAKDEPSIATEASADLQNRTPSPPPSVYPNVKFTWKGGGL